MENFLRSSDVNSSKHVGLLLAFINLTPISVTVTVKKGNIQEVILRMIFKIILIHNRKDSEKFKLPSVQKLKFLFNHLIEICF